MKSVRPPCPLCWTAGATIQTIAMLEVYGLLTRTVLTIVALGHQHLVKLPQIGTPETIIVGHQNIQAIRRA